MIITYNVRHKQGRIQEGGHISASLGGGKSWRRQVLGTAKYFNNTIRNDLTKKKNTCPKITVYLNGTCRPNAAIVKWFLDGSAILDWGIHQFLAGEEDNLLFINCLILISRSLNVQKILTNHKIEKVQYWRSACL